MNEMIEKAAWRVSQRTGIELSELIGVGHVVAMQAIRSYDPTKGMLLTSWVYRCLGTGLFNFCKKNDDPHQTEDFDPDLLPNGHPEWDPEKWLGFKDMLKTLSSEAQLVCSLILQGPGPSRTPKQVRGYIRRQLIKQHRWTHAKVWRVFDEIKEVLK